MITELCNNDYCYGEQQLLFKIPFSACQKQLEALRKDLSEDLVVIWFVALFFYLTHDIDWMPLASQIPASSVDLGKGIIGDIC